MIPRDQFWGKDLFRWFPRIVRVGVPLPLDQVLKSPVPSMITVVRNGFHFEFLLPINKVRRRPRVIGPVLIGLLIRGQQTCVKYVMDGPGRGESESISDGGNLLRDKERAMTSGGQFERLIR